jgi:hypothetical protein
MLNRKKTHAKSLLQIYYYFWSPPIAIRLGPKQFFKQKNKIMANNHFDIGIYRKNQYDLKDAAGNPAAQGVLMSFPSGLTFIEPAPANTTANGVTMQSIISLLPAGLNQLSNKYYSAADVATLSTAAT